MAYEACFQEALTDAAQRVVAAGAYAVAILDAQNKLLALAGQLDDGEARAITSLGLHQATNPRALLLRGEVVEVRYGSLGPGAHEPPAGRVARIGIAARCLFFVIAYREDPAAVPTAVADLRADIERIVADALSRPWLPRPSGAGGSSSGPAELPVVELGITVPRARN